MNTIPSDDRRSRHWVVLTKLLVFQVVWNVRKIPTAIKEKNHDYCEEFFLSTYSSLKTLRWFWLSRSSISRDILGHTLAKGFSSCFVFCSENKTNTDGFSWVSCCRALGTQSHLTLCPNGLFSSLFLFSWRVRSMIRSHAAHQFGEDVLPNKRYPYYNIRDTEIGTLVWNIIIWKTLLIESFQLQQLVGPYSIE